jgi:predicted O-methyltransferase YrrM
MNYLKRIYAKFVFPLWRLGSFYWNSKNEHGVHSPFVFSLVTKCFYDKKNYPEYAILKDFRKSLLANSNKIEVTDFGAGSRVFKSNIRAINQIAKNAGISKRRAELLFRIVRYLKPEGILEIGTSLGLATVAMAAAKPENTIISLEGCEATASVAKKHLQDFGFVARDVNIVVTAFEPHLKLIYESANSKKSWPVYGMIYFDGNHTKQATLDYFELLLPTVANETVWIFDDIHWSKGMEEAWEIIKEHPKVTVTIDTFQWGMVFFRLEQPKEHFVIRV